MKCIFSCHTLSNQLVVGTLVRKRLQIQDISVQLNQSSTFTVCFWSFSGEGIEASGEPPDRSLPCFSCTVPNRCPALPASGHSWHIPTRTCEIDPYHLPNDPNQIPNCTCRTMVRSLSQNFNRSSQVNTLESTLPFSQGIKGSSRTFMGKQYFVINFQFPARYIIVTLLTIYFCRSHFFGQKISQYRYITPWSTLNLPRAL